MTLARALVSLAFVAPLLLPAVAPASPVYTAATTDGTIESNSTGATSSGTVSAPLLNEPAGSSFTRQESAAANTAGLHATAGSTINVLPAANLADHSVTGSASTSLLFDDFIVSGPGSGTVSGSVNLHLNGSLDTTIDHNGIFIGSLLSQLNLFVKATVAGNTYSGSYTQAHSISTYCDGNTPVCSDTVSSSGDGLLSTNGTLPVNLTTSSFQVPINVPFSLGLEFDLTSTADSSVAGTGCDQFGCIASLLINTVGDFSNTFGFPAAGPVFNLPDGYTLNSREAGIAENQITGGPTTVPEPGTLALVTLGLATLRLRRRNRKASTPH